MTRFHKSIVLVTVDCLRADHCGFMGYERPTTPYLDSLAAESIVFPAAIVAGSPTYYSLPAILASRYPLALGRDVLGLAPKEPTLATVVKQAGYKTAAFTAANPYVTSRFGYTRGFDRVRDFMETETELLQGLDGGAGTGWASLVNRQLQRMRPAMGPIRMVYDELYFRYCQRATRVTTSLDGLRRFPAADVLVDEASRWIASVGDSPFFLWLHLMDPHSPYYPKEEALALLGNAVTPYAARYRNSYWNRSDLGAGRLANRIDQIIELYDAGIRWVDQQLARLTQSLRELNRWDDCIFALTADHGEEFLDHGGRYHPPSKMAEELIHVPLLLRAPGSPRNRPDNSPFSLIHLAPTLLDAARLAAPQQFQGHSYWREADDISGSEEIAISECVAGCTNPFHSDNRMGSRLLSVRESRFKLVLGFNPPREDLYDLLADPREQSPLLLGQHKQAHLRLLRAAYDHIHRSIAQRDCQDRVEARLLEIRLEWKASEDSATPVAS